MITIASAYRLAKFNIDLDQQSYFKGLPVPANTLLILSLPLIQYYQYSVTIANFGVGFKYKGIEIDYAFTDIGDQSAALYSNVFSVKLDFSIFR